MNAQGGAVIVRQRAGTGVRWTVATSACRSRDGIAHRIPTRGAPTAINGAATTISSSCCTMCAASHCSLHSSSGGDKRNHQGDPSGRERQGLERADAAPVPGVPPQPDDAGGVDDRSTEDEATGKHRAPSAESLPRVSEVRTARTTRGRARP